MKPRERRLLIDCLALDAVYSIQYVDYAAVEYTAPVKLTPDRLKAFIDDNSLREIKVTITIKT